MTNAACKVTDRRQIHDELVVWVAESSKDKEFVASPGVVDAVEFSLILTNVLVLYHAPFMFLFLHSKHKTLQLTNLGHKLALSGFLDLSLLSIFLKLDIKCVDHGLDLVQKQLLTALKYIYDLFKVVLDVDHLLLKIKTQALLSLIDFAEGVRARVEPNIEL